MHPQGAKGAKSGAEGAFSAICGVHNTSPLLGDTSKRAISLLVGGMEIWGTPLVDGGTSRRVNATYARTTVRQLYRRSFIRANEFKTKDPYIKIA